MVPFSVISSDFEWLSIQWHKASHGLSATAEVLVCDLIVGCHVFTNKTDAIKLIKEMKGGRFKAFSKRVDAEEFCMNVCSTNSSTHAAEMVAVFVNFCYFYRKLAHWHAILLQQFCLSVMFRYCMETAWHFVIFSSPHSSPIILVLSASNTFTKFRQGHPLWGH